MVAGRLQEGGIGAETLVTQGAQRMRDVCLRGLCGAVERGRGCISISGRAAQHAGISDAPWSIGAVHRVTAHCITDRDRHRPVRVAASPKSERAATGGSPVQRSGFSAARAPSCIQPARPLGSSRERFKCKLWTHRWWRAGPFAQVVSDLCNSRRARCGPDQRIDRAYRKPLQDYCKTSTPVSLSSHTLTHHEKRKEEKTPHPPQPHSHPGLCPLARADTTIQATLPPLWQRRFYPEGCTRQRPLTRPILHSRSFQPDFLCVRGGWVWALVRKFSAHVYPRFSAGPSPCPSSSECDGNVAYHGTTAVEAASEARGRRDNLPYECTRRSRRGAPPGGGLGRIRNRSIRS